ncbi:MAG TPA: D-aminoacyl-tRNA deacylase, partial [Fimbriimonas sp.]|nr:D-aminoacyl-tRNA deacylase [Fimbriimonas sp.]
MRAIVQRVSSSSVSIEGQVVGKSGEGYLLLVGIHREDDLADVEKLATKIANLRLFNDVAGKINLSILEVMESRPASILAISNFTVYGDVAKNRRPSFVDSAPFERGKELFDLLLL